MIVSNPAESPVAAPGGQPLLARLSKNISARRKALGLTQAQLAEQLGVDTETLSRFERGMHLPSLDRLEQLAGLLLITIADLLAEEPPKADDEVSMLSAWLMPLSPQDRDFAKGVLKQCCDYLNSRQPAQPVVVKTAESVTFSEVVQALLCPVSELEGNIDNVLSLIEHGLRIELLSGTRRQFVTKQNVSVLFEAVPALRDRIVSRFPGSAAEVTTKKIKPKPPARATRFPFSEPPSKGDSSWVDTVSPTMLSPSVDASVSEPIEEDAPAIPRQSGLPTACRMWRVEAIFEVDSLVDKFVEIAALLDAKKVIGLAENGKHLRKVTASTAYALYQCQPALRDAVLTKYPDAKKRERVDKKEEASDLEASDPKTAPTKNRKPHKVLAPLPEDTVDDPDEEEGVEADE
jgi:transcriptional regulator with XRE-family HTH domain